jgi:hypothetical protein
MAAVRRHRETKGCAAAGDGRKPVILARELVRMLGRNVFSRLHVLCLAARHLLVLARRAAGKEVLLFGAKSRRKNLGPSPTRVRRRGEWITIRPALIDSGHLPAHRVAAIPCVKRTSPEERQKVNAGPPRWRLKRAPCLRVCLRAFSRCLRACLRAFSRSLSVALQSLQLCPTIVSFLSSIGTRSPDSKGVSGNP